MFQSSTPLNRIDFPRVSKDRLHRCGTKLLLKSVDKRLHLARGFFSLKRRFETSDRKVKHGSHFARCA